MNKLGEQGIPFLFIIDFEMDKPVILKLDEAANGRVFFSVNGMRNFEEPVSDRQPLYFTKKPVDFPTYHSAFQKVMKQIHLGNTFLLNLTFPTEIETNWSLRKIFEESNAPYRLLYQDQFVLFSPECFVRIADGVISSYPMKGTIDASLPGAAAALLSDKKENAEHATIVDLIRNDLSMVSNQVTVKRYRYLEEVVAHDKSLLQVSSEITGILPEDYRSNLGTFICRLLPAGSVSGAPKPSTLKIIREVENYRRGYYTGVFGIFDGADLDSAVMIRYIENENGRLVYKSGGGITMNSDAEKEYRELIDKVYVTIH
ncbi:MAG TPA: aminodeoxychorismate synthase component I [Prolixibacteraceae bacterium]|nr:aminodeoxychorismate synthase component I [Prolixibacteraceae bacterium]